MSLVALNAYSGLSKVVAFAHRFGGEQAFARADLDLAHSRLVAALEWEPDDASTLVLLGRVIQSSLANSIPLKAMEGKSSWERFGAGYGAIVAGIGLNPADAWAWFNLTTLYQGYRTSASRLEKMRRAGEAAMAGASPPPAVLEGQPSLKLEPEDKITAAITLQAIELHPFYGHHEYLAGFYWKLGMKKEAGESIRRSMELAPQPAHHALLQDREFLTGLADAILDGIERAPVRDVAGTIIKQQSLAEVLSQLGRIEEAIAAYERLRASGGEWVAGECDLAIGRLEQARGRYRESMEPLTRVIDAGKGNWLAIDAHYLLGLAHARLGDHDAAARQLRRFLTLAPDRPEGYYSLAEELEALGRWDEADNLCMASVRRFPREPAMYRWSIAQLRKRGRDETALEYARALARLDPKDAENQRLILEIQHELERLPR